MLKWYKAKRALVVRRVVIGVLWYMSAGLVFAFVSGS